LGNRDRSRGCKNKSIRQNAIEKYAVDQLLNNIFSDHVIADVTKKILDYAQKYDVERNDEIDFLEQKRTVVEDRAAYRCHRGRHWRQRIDIKDDPKAKRKIIEAFYR
jgi:hypothetical protein